MTCDAAIGRPRPSTTHRYQWQPVFFCSRLSAQIVSDVIQIKDEQLWKKITATHTCSLTDLLANQPTYQSLRQCGDDYILPRIRTGCFKSCFANRSLFTFI